MLDPKLNYQKPGTEPYIFVSYAHKDRDRVLPIIERLDREGFRRWYDSGIGYTEPWHDVIAERVKNCAVFLNVLTSNSAVSKNCQREVYLADKYNKDLFFILLDEPDSMALPDGIELMITPTQYLDRTNEHVCPTEEVFLTELCETPVMQKCRKAAEEKPSDSAPPAPEPEPKPIRYDPDKFKIVGTTLVKVFLPRETVVVPDGVKKIGRCAFANLIDTGRLSYNDATKEIILPDSVIVLEEHAIDSCRRLQRIFLPDGLRRIGNYAFCSCESLERLKLPDTLKTVGGVAFGRCSALESVTLPQGIKAIGWNAFIFCHDSLTIHMSRHTDPALLTPESIASWNPDNRPIEFYD